MARVDCSITIDRPIEDVFGVLTDVEKTPLWVASAVEEHMTTTGPVGVGSRRRAVGRIFGRRVENEAEVTEFEPNRRWTMRSMSGPSFVASATFESVAGGTRVDWSWTFRSGVVRLADPLVANVFHRRFSKDLRELKRLMEGGSL